MHADEKAAMEFMNQPGFVVNQTCAYGETPFNTVLLALHYSSAMYNHTRVALYNKLAIRLAEKKADRSILAQNGRLLTAAYEEMQKEESLRYKPHDALLLSLGCKSLLEVETIERIKELESSCCVIM
jgi:hypothetical protein